MIIIKVGSEPYPSWTNDVWFDPTTKISKRNIGTNLSNTQIIWATMVAGNIAMQPVPTFLGEVWIDPVTAIPHVFDGTFWISAVPNTYLFPSRNPNVGDMWTDSLSQTAYIFNGSSWVFATTQKQSVTSQVTSIPLPSPAAGAIVPGINVPTPNTVVPLGNSTLTIHGPNNNMLVTIDTVTGTIMYGPSYTPDAAAQIFWRAISGTSPKFMQNQIDTLIKDLKVVSSQLVVAEGNVLRFTELGYKLPEPLKPFDPNDSWDRAMGIIK